MYVFIRCNNLPAPVRSQAYLSDITVEGPESIKIWMQTKMVEATQMEPAKRDSSSIDLIKAALAKPTHVVEQKLCTWLETNFKIKSQRNVKKNEDSGHDATDSQRSNTQNTQTQNRKTPNYGKKLSGKGRRADQKGIKRLRTYTTRTGQR